mmetsp:Transcript_9568/g.15306  ORF Transcript_9568/g.15306 Transcript_9568/m.15306 type:complete len:202 (-) Transcript_9568:1838-2443(-)
MAPRMPKHPNVNHTVVLAGILLFSAGVLLGALLPVPRPVLPRRTMGTGYGANMDALLVSQASDGFAVIPGVNNKHAFGLGDSAAYGMDEQYNVGGGMTVDDAGCRCPEAGYESTVDPAAKSAADLMGAFDGGMGQLAEPKLSLEEAINRIDALTRSRIHLGKEKQNLEGERNQLNRQVKETRYETIQCQKELKRIKVVTKP